LPGTGCVYEGATDPVPGDKEVAGLLIVNSRYYIISNGIFFSRRFWCKKVKVNDISTEEWTR
jgi:hypothetical protein